MGKLSAEERDKKVLEHIKLVQYLAHKYKINGNVLDIDDLIQEGSLGLMEAADTYDSLRGNFVSYATMIILQSLIRVLKANDGVFSVGHVMYRLVCACKNFVLLYSREPSAEEFEVIVKSIGVTYKNALIIYHGYIPFSRKDSIGGGDVIEEHYLIEQASKKEDTNQIPNTEKNIKIELLDKLLRKCKSNERHVIRKYYGLWGKKGLTLQEIANKMKVSVSRAGNIKSAGEKRLRELLKSHRQMEEAGEWPGYLPIGTKKIKKHC